MRTRWYLAAAVGWLSLAGCTAADDRSQVIEVTSDSGRLTALLTPVPDPPVVGNNSLDIALSRTDSDEPLAIESVAVAAVELWMPAHGHGTASPPRVNSIDRLPDSDAGEDNATVVIHLSSVRYLMAGRWEVHLTTRVDGATEVFVASQEVR